MPYTLAGPRAFAQPPAPCPPPRAASWPGRGPRAAFLAHRAGTPGARRCCPATPPQRAMPKHRETTAAAARGWATVARTRYAVRTHLSIDLILALEVSRPSRHDMNMNMRHGLSSVPPILQRRRRRGRTSAWGGMAMRHACRPCLNVERHACRRELLLQGHPHRLRSSHMQVHLTTHAPRSTRAATHAPAPVTTCLAAPPPAAAARAAPAGGR